nr:MAG TPA: 40S ribosomal subunit ribosome [Caudoviricetes sp.]
MARDYIIRHTPSQFGRVFCVYNGNSKDCRL